MTQIDLDESGFASIFVTAKDGLRLHGRIYEPRVESDRAPVVCLAGLTRNAADFHALARHLSQHETAPRRVIALDYRGRGESGYDANWENYDPRVEAQDALDYLTAVGAHDAIFVGTSRGGLVIFALAAMRPTLVRAAILNDIGPVIDARGLIRIRGYVGKMPQPANFEQAADILKHIADAQFTAATEADWLRQARALWREADGKLIPRYDLNLMKGLAALDLEKPLPDLWPFFLSLRDKPVLAIRGANSDLLAAATLQEMSQRHADCATYTVPNQGHAPLLDDAATFARIDEFIAHAESKHLERVAV